MHLLTSSSSTVDILSTSLSFRQHSCRRLTLDIPLCHPHRPAAGEGAHAEREGRACGWRCGTVTSRTRAPRSRGAWTSSGPRTRPPAARAPRTRWTCATCAAWCRRCPSTGGAQGSESMHTVGSADAEPCSDRTCDRGETPKPTRKTPISAIGCTGCAQRCETEVASVVSDCSNSCRAQPSAAA